MRPAGLRLTPWYRADRESWDENKGNIYTHDALHNDLLSRRFLENEKKFHRQICFIPYVCTNVMQIFSLL
jgi:hypothetical protein